MIYMTFLGGVLGLLPVLSLVEKAQKHPLKKSYRSYFRRAQIRWVIWPSSLFSELNSSRSKFAEKPITNWMLSYLTKRNGETLANWKWELRIQLVRSESTICRQWNRSKPCDQHLRIENVAIYDFNCEDQVPEHSDFYRVLNSLALLLTEIIPKMPICWPILLKTLWYPPKRRRSQKIGR